jgi:hypothetical protein
MILENRWLSEGVKPQSSIPCSKCGGLSIRLPVSESIGKLFEEIKQKPLDQNFQHFRSIR